MKHFIVLDGGTQNIKAFVFNEYGEIVSSFIEPVVPYFSKKPEFAEQDAEKYVSVMANVTKEALRRAKVNKEDYVAVAITSHRSTVVPVDRNGTPVRSAITWLDERMTEGLKFPGIFTGLIAKIIGEKHKLDEFQRRSKFNWLKVYEPQNYEKTDKFLTMSSYIFKEITGKIKDCSSMIVGLFPIDLKNLRWHTNPLIYKIFGVEKKKLPPLVSPTDIAGYVSKASTEKFGLPENVPVIISAGDKQAELLGAGGITSDIAEISYGTAAVIEIFSRKYVTHKDMDFFTWGSAIPNTWVLEGSVWRGYWMISWFEKEFAKHEVALAKEKGVSPESILDSEMEKVPPGSEGLILQPYWSPFVADPSSKGAIIGFSGNHTRIHIYRAIIEGIAYELRRVKEVIESYTGYKIKELRAGGGGSRSREIMQITADIFNLPVKKIHTEHLAALGAAIDAAVATKTYPDFETAVSKMVKVTETFLPNPKNADVYDRLFNEVYKKIYPSLKDVYHTIDNILKQKSSK